MGLMGNSKWGRSSSDASTPEPEAPKAPRNNHGRSGMHEFIPAYPKQGIHFSDTPKDHSDKCQENNNINNSSKQPLAERLTRENSQPNPHNGPRRDQQELPTKPGLTERLDSPRTSHKDDAFGHLGNGIDHGYGSAMPPAPVSELITLEASQLRTSSHSPHLDGACGDRPFEYKKQEVTERLGNGIDHGCGGISKLPAQLATQRGHDRPIFTEPRAEFFQRAVAPAIAYAGKRIAKSSSVMKVVSFVAPPPPQTAEAPVTVTPTAETLTPVTTSTSVPCKKASSLPAICTPPPSTQRTSAKPAFSVPENTTFRIPPQTTLSDTNYHFLLAKLQGREISAVDWEFAVQRVQNFEIGKPLVVVAQHGYETMAQSQISHAQDVPTHVGDTQKSIHAEPRAGESSSFVSWEKAKTEASGFDSGVSVIRKQKDEVEAVQHQEQQAAHSGPHFWDKVKQKLDMVDDEVKQPVSAGEQIQNEDVDEEW